MRILFGSWPGHGHLLPMVPMIRAAQQGGHDVVVSSGAALALHPDEITADAVAEALGRLLNEPSFSRAANRLRAEIERMPTAAAVLHELLVTTDQ